MATIVVDSETRCGETVFIAYSWFDDLGYLAGEGPTPFAALRTFSELWRERVGGE